LVSDILETTELALDDEINSDLNSPLSRSFVTSETMKISVGLTDLSNDLDVILKVDGEILAGGDERGTSDENFSLCLLAGGDERGHRTCGNGIPRH
jgi:hypothetical protein